MVTQDAELIQKYIFIKQSHLAKSHTHHSAYKISVHHRTSGC